jgi:type II secretory pathway pseudopilin PulG
MSRLKRGFTLIEVSIFLAVTGLLFIGITVGVQNSIFHQRYNDAVQSFADFLRGVYDGVLNVQGFGGGRSEDTVVYGKMIVFDSQGDDSDGGDSGSGESNGCLKHLKEAGLETKQGFCVYTLVGQDPDVLADKDSDITEDIGLTALLRKVGLSTTISVDSGDSGESTGGGEALAGVIETYSPKWGVGVQEVGESELVPLKGTIMIVRHPYSGKVHTLFSYDAMEGDGQEGFFNPDEFSYKDVDFCINPNGIGGAPSAISADVRIAKNAGNAVGIDVIMDSENNKCRRRGV